MVKRIIAINQIVQLWVILNVFFIHVFIHYFMISFVHDCQGLIMRVVDSLHFFTSGKWKSLWLCEAPRYASLYQYGKSKRKNPHSALWKLYQKLEKMGFTDVGPDNQPVRWVKILLAQPNGQFRSPLQAEDTIIWVWE